MGTGALDPGSCGQSLNALLLNPPAGCDRNGYARRMIDANMQLEATHSPCSVTADVHYSLRKTGQSVHQQQESIPLCPGLSQKYRRIDGYVESRREADGGSCSPFVSSVKGYRTRHRSESRISLRGAQCAYLMAGKRPARATEAGPRPVHDNLEWQRSLRLGGGGTLLA